MWFQCEPPPSGLSGDDAHSIPGLATQRATFNLFNRHPPFPPSSSHNIAYTPQALEEIDKRPPLQPATHDIMRFALLSFVLALFVAITMAVAPLQPVIISFPKEAPDSLLESAKEAIKKAGGVITHEYSEFVLSLSSLSGPESEGATSPDGLGKGGMEFKKRNLMCNADIIKGFACQAPASILETVSAMSAEFPALIESDGIMTTQEQESKAGH